MRLKELLRRINGFSLPVVGGGLQWVTPTDSERDIARRVLSFLADRRVLYNPTEVEQPEHCIDSVLAIREMLTRELGPVAPDRPLAVALNALRAECRAFLDANAPNRRHILVLRPDAGYPSWVFQQSLGSLRRGFGYQLAVIAGAHGIDLDDNLASTIPPKP